MVARRVREDNGRVVRRVKEDHEGEVRLGRRHNAGQAVQACPAVHASPTVQPHSHATGGFVGFGRQDVADTPLTVFI